MAFVTAYFLIWFTICIRILYRKGKKVRFRGESGMLLRNLKGCSFDQRKPVKQFQLSFCLNFKQLFKIWTGCLIFSLSHLIHPLAHSTPNSASPRSQRSNNEKIIAAQMTQSSVREDDENKVDERRYFYQDDFYNQSVHGNNSWLNTLFAEDDEGIMDKMRNQIQEWEQRREYVELWNLESTGAYAGPSEKDRNNFLRKHILKFLDRKFSREMKKEDASTTLKKAGEVEQMLRPNSNIQINEKVKVRFKARILQGHATMQVQNPYFDWSTNFKTNGEVQVSMAKDLSLLGVKTGLDYFSRNGKWRASVDKQITRNISSVVSSEQKTRSMAFSGESEQKIELKFYHPF